MVRLSIFSGIVMQVVLSGLLFVAARWLVGIFVPAGAEGGDEVIRMGASYLRTLAPFLLLVPVSASWAGAQYGSGRTLGPALAALLANLIVKLPAAWLLSQLAGMKTSGVWLAIGISVAVEAAVNAGFYFQGRWERTGLHAAA
jgi:Na+-driven multidrug efflux pump